MREIDGILYCNDGDWVESRTALVEHFDGSLQLVHWTPSHETGGRLGPERCLAIHQRLQVGRREVAQVDARRGGAGLRFGQVERLLDRRREPVDHVGRRAGRREDRHPGFELEAREPRFLVVGTCGTPGCRTLLVTASPLSLPAWMCPITEGGVVMNTCTWPDSTSAIAAPEPRYGMWTMLVPVCILNISVPTCDSEPLPCDA